MNNAIEPAQSALLTATLEPWLLAQNPEANFFIGQDVGIYWDKTDPPMLGCKSPDWYLVLDVPRLLDGILRRSYVMWQEGVSPLIILEYASDAGAGERDGTPRRGKFWVYERRIRPAYYGIYLPDESAIEMYCLQGNQFEPMKPNAAERFAIAPLGVELGLWHGELAGSEQAWMRWWDAQGNILPTGQELADQETERADQAAERADQAVGRAEQEKRRAEQEKKRADREKKRADQECEMRQKLAEKLRALGVDPDKV